MIAPTQPGWSKRRRRAQERRRARNTTETAQKEAIRQAHKNGETAGSQPVRAFDLSGKWMQKRAEVRDALGASQVPKDKTEARAWLIEAGYQVKE